MVLRGANDTDDNRVGSGKKTDGGRLAARTLKEAGVEVVFVLHGGHLETFLGGCEEQGIRLVDMRHEAAAVNAADAYSRTTGKLGVAAVTSGPGLTNALAGITNSAADGTSVLVITSSPPLNEAEMRELQGGLDLVAMVRPVTKWAHKALEVSRVADLVSLGIRHALTPPCGPVVVDLPINVAFKRIDEAFVKKNGAPTIPEPGPTPEAAINEAANLLQAAERPVIIVGEGTFSEDLSTPLLALAEAASIPVFYSNLGFCGLPGPHPLNGGTASFLGMVGEEPDLVILAGARQGLYTGSGDATMVPTNARVIQIDADPAELGRIYPVDVAIAGSCANALGALAEARRWEPREEWSAKAVSMRNALDFLFPDADEEEDGIHPYAAVTAALDQAPPQTILVTDGGESASWANWSVGHRDMAGTLNLGYQGHLGVGQGFAIGAQLAHPEKRVLQIVGDGAIGFHIQEWDSMVRHSLPIVTVILNNACWGISNHGQETIRGADNHLITKLNPTAYEIVAQGFGAHGELVERLEDLGPAVQRAFEAGVPAVVNVRVSLSVVHPITIAMHGEVQSEDGVVIPYYQNEGD